MRLRTIATFTGRVLAWMVIFASALALVLGFLIPKVGGGTPYAVLTGSMAPTYPAGSMVVVKPVDPGTLRVGDVITFQLVSGEPTVATHRVVSVQHRLDGELRFETQGDANSEPDADLRLPEQIRGEVWYSVPYMGHVTVLFGSQRGALTTVAALGLLGYAAWMFIGARRDRRAKHAGEPEADPQSGEDERA